MKRHILSITIALSLVFGLSVTASAATVKQARAADALYHMDLFQGRTETGKDFDLESGLTRAEGTLMVIRLLGKEEEAYTRDLANTPFPDVADFWLGKAPFIAYAYEEGLMNGVTTYANGVTTLTFEPRAAMNDRMYLTLILRVLGYPDENKTYIWNNAWQLAYNAGLVDSTEKDAEFTRGDAALVAWKALGANLYGSTKTLASKLMGEGLFTIAEYAEAKEIWKYGYVLDNTPSSPSSPNTPTDPSAGGNNTNNSDTDNAGDSSGSTTAGDSATQPWDAEGAKQPSEYTWAEFEALTGTEREAFFEWFETAEDFDAWMNSVQSTESFLPWENGGKQPSEYTWAEFEALTGAEQEAFFEWFETVEDFDAWMNSVQSTENSLPWENGGKQPSEYTWAEFEALTGAEQEAFFEWFETVEDFDVWLTANQS